jgi:peroxiredoxin
VDAEIIGISKDSVARHDKFKAKYELPFTLAADEDGSMCSPMPRSGPSLRQCGESGTSFPVIPQLYL